MAAQSSVEIVISAQDRFSPAFRQLDEAFARSERSGGSARGALDDLNVTLTQVSQGAHAAGDSTAGFAERAGESLGAFAALREELEQHQATVSEELGVAHGERMLAIEQNTQQALIEADMAGNQARLASDEAFWAALDARAEERRKRTLQSDGAVLDARLGLYRTFYVRLANLAETQGRAMAGVSKSLAIAAALVDAYRAANAALASVPFPLNFAAAALVLAEGLANVQRIRQVNVAHGGLEDVPEDSTFLLRRGERVIAPRQNEALTDFLRREREGARGAPVIEHLEVHILENATAGAALLSLGAAEWRQVVAEKIVPALTELAGLGIRPGYIGSGT